MQVDPSLRFLSSPSVPYFLRRPLILLVFLGAAALVVFSFWRSQEKDAGQWRKLAGPPVLILGRVAGDPVVRSGGDSFLLQASWVRPSGGGAFRFEKPVWVHRQKPVPLFRWGDAVSVWGPLAVEGRRKVPVTLFVPEGRSFLLRRAALFHPLRWAGALRDQFRAAFQSHLSEKDALLLSGVLLGDRLPGLEVLAEDFRRSGLYHLLVASGSNVGFALGVWWLAARWLLWWPRRWTLAAVPSVAFLYAGMAGGDPPVLRAALMATVAAIGALLGRRDRTEHALFLSAGILILLNPESLFQAGFQMSYAATWALLRVWGHPFAEAVKDKEEEGPSLFFRFSRWGGQLFGASLAAQVALAPFLLYYFGRFSWVGIAANMVAVPLAGVCLWLGAGLALMDPLWPWAAAQLAVFTRGAVEALASWAHWCAQVPGAEWRLSIGGAQAGVLGAGIFLALIFFPSMVRVSEVRGTSWTRVFWTFGLWVGATGILFVAMAPPTLSPSLDLSWTGGRSPSLWVRTEEGTTVFEKTRSLGKKSEVKRRVWLSEDFPDPDGTRWSEGKTQWRVVRPVGGKGVAFRLAFGDQRVFLNFGLNATQQKNLGADVLAPVDLLSWTSHTGGPPSDEVLARLDPRWMVYQGSRVPQSVRRLRGVVYRPRRDGLRWIACGPGAGFSQKEGEGIH